VACCATLDAVLADEPEGRFGVLPLAGLRLLVPTTVALDDLDREVASAFDAPLARLSRAGARVERAAVPEFDEVASMNASGGFTAAESYAWHRGLIARHGRELYDPRVIARILRGSALSAADYIDLLDARRSFVRRVEARLIPFDAMLMPSVAILPPRVSDLDSDEAFARANLLALRNATLVNVMDGCAISIPVHGPGEAPVGLMLAGTAGADHRLMAVAAAAEREFDHR
jgi:aspartyl-tRNA(Asn)/glutamyl-tRNA(Gln) amidotransferase subunit A